MSKEKNKLTERQVEKRNNRIKFLKSLIFPVILTLIIVIGVLVVFNYQNAEEEQEIIAVEKYMGDEKPIVVENDKFKFTMDPMTTQFNVEVKETGKIWYSNPAGGASDSLALQDEKNRLQSTLLMSYMTETGLETTYNSYAYSVMNGIYDIKTEGNTVTVSYSLGEVQKEFIIPTVCKKTDFDKWIANMSDKDATSIKQYYEKKDINNLKKKDRNNKDELLEKYPILADEIIYILRDNAKDNVRNKFEGIFAEAGYTLEDYAKDKELDLSESSNDKPVFNVDVEYTLEEDGLKVNVPMKSIEYKKEFPVYTLTLLPYFGCGGPTDGGYLFVPEGGGSVINFNNGKVSQSNYYTNVYGWDMCLTRDAVVHNTRAYYGVYGVANQDDSFICILEDGSSYASIQADIAGKTNSYNYVNAIYSICEREQYDVGEIANSDVFKFIQELPDEDISQKFRFVSSGDYVDMAKDYESYLKEQYGSYLSLNEDTNAPVAVEIVGAAEKVKQIVGVPVSRPLKLTSYEEAGDIIQILTEDGIKNLSVKFVGWCNKGVNQRVLEHVKTISDLGSKSDLRDLTAKAKELGVNLYLNGVTMYAYESDIFDGFFSFTDAAKLISKERAELYRYSHVTYAAREHFKPYYLLHTNKAMEMVDNLLEAAQDFGAQGVSFEDIGEDLAADYYLDDFHSRQSVLELQKDKFKAMDDKGLKLMINMGNDYAVPYSDIVTNMDLRGSEYTIIDECVPFFQLAIHGYIDYTGNPINICGNPEEEILYSAEYGAGLQFSLMKETAFVLQNTYYTEYYGSNFDSWHDRMVEICTRYNNELGHTFNQEMTGHDNLTPTLSCTVYADGTKVYVNYGYSDETADGVTVPARDYLVVK